MTIMRNFRTTLRGGEGREISRGNLQAHDYVPKTVEHRNIEISRGNLQAHFLPEYEIGYDTYRPFNFP